MPSTGSRTPTSGSCWTSDSAAVFESAGWSVVLVTRWTDVDAAWLATTRGATLLTPPPPDPGTRQLRMDEMMGHARGRATA